MLIFHTDSRIDIKMSFKQPFRAVLRGGREQGHQIFVIFAMIDTVLSVNIKNLTFYLNPIIQNKDVLIDR